MKDRGKAVETDYFNYSASSDLPCPKHPSSSSSIGICAQCLKERLIKLVCSDCGEQRLSSCSCSDVSSSTNPKLSNVEIGSVGRVSFLIENDKTDQTHHPEEATVGLLKRSGSLSVEGQKGHFWKIGRFFRMKKKKRDGGDVWGFDDVGVSRSRSLCSFRGGGGFNDHQDELFCSSSAKVSDFNGVVDDKCLKRGEIDSALFGTHRSVFPLKESDFSAMDDTNFIDLKLDLSSESKGECSAPKVSGLSDSDLGGLKSGAFLEYQKGGGYFGNLVGDGVLGYGGGSCRITVNEREIKKGQKGHKVWRWIVKHHQGGWRSSSSKKYDNQSLKL